VDSPAPAVLSLEAVDYNLTAAAVARIEPAAFINGIER
jgi:hypothetical protein